MSQNFLSLDGIWKFKWVENADQRPTDFYLTNLDDSHWGTIPVPGNWELNGYGQPEYVNIGFAWADISMSSRLPCQSRTIMWALTVDR